MSKKNETKIVIQPPTSKDDIIMTNSPRFHHKEKKENESFLKRNEKRYFN